MRYKHGDDIISEEEARQRARFGAEVVALDDEPVEAVETDDDDDDDDDEGVPLA